MRLVSLPGLMLLLVAGLYAPLSIAAELDKTEQKIAAWVDENLEAAISLLEETVNIGSGTMNHAGVRKVGNVMARELEAAGLDTRWIEMPEELNRAGHLFARHDGNKGRATSLFYMH